MQCVEGLILFHLEAFGCRNSTSVQPSLAVCYFSFDLISEPSTPGGNGLAEKLNEPPCIWRLWYSPEIQGPLQEMMTGLQGVWADHTGLMLLWSE